VDEVIAEIQAAGRYARGIRRAFLADGDALAAPLEALEAILGAMKITVLYSGVFRPQAQYVLERAGFPLARISRNVSHSRERWRRDASVQILSPARRGAGWVAYVARWSGVPARRLTRKRYLSSEVLLTFTDATTRSP